MTNDEFNYDVFISYSRRDQRWVQDWLLPHLRTANLRVCIDFDCFEPGAPIVTEIERVVQASRKTLVVLTTDYLASAWGEMENILVTTLDPAARQRRLLPLMLKPCDLPLRLRALTYLDFTEPAVREGGLRRLLASLGAPPLPADAVLELADLPLDTIPDLAPLPPGSRMPLNPNPLFVGREADLQALAVTLKVGDIAAIGHVEVAAATGLGGIGKTQLASEFVHRYGQYFRGGVFWLSFADPSAVPAEVAACGGLDALDLRPDFDSLSLDDQVRLVLAAWRDPLARLLVFDNCEDEELLAKWRPRVGGCRVLVTSRRATWDATLGVHALALGVLSREESLALLGKYRRDLAKDDVHLDAIAQELGDLPLALHLAGSFLARYRYAVTPVAYLEELQDKALLDHPSLQGRGATRSPTDHELHVARTFALSYNRLDSNVPSDALAQTLLAHAVHFAHGEPIPRALLLETMDLGEEDPEAVLQAEDALARLVELGLLESGAEGRLRLHRLLAKFVRDTAVGEMDAAQERVETAVIEVAERLNEAGLPTPLLAWQPHLRAVTNAAQVREDERAARLCTVLGHHLWLSGVYDEAQPYWEEALRFRQKVLGDEHPDTAQSLNNLGTLLIDQGDLAGAQPYLERALEISLKTLGDENPYTAQCLNNLGGLLYEKGDLAGARSHFEQALAILPTALGEENPNTALTISNLGYVLQAQGDFAGAKLHLEQALSIWRKVYGDEHPQTAFCLYNLGTLLQAQRDFAGAQTHLEQALMIWRKVLGDEHPYTALCLNSLGDLLLAQGDLAGARSNLKWALTIRQKVLGPKHPDTAQSLKSLGTLSQAQGDLAEARSYFKQSLAICEEALGADHPTTHAVQDELAALDAP